MRGKGLAALTALAWAVLSPPAWAVDDQAISIDERLTEDGEEPEPEERAAFSADARVRAREVRPPGSTYQAAPPELQHNVYFYSRLRAARGPVSAGGMVKRAAVGPALSLDNIREFGLWKGNAAWRGAGPVARAVAGNFTLAFGQGLLFYDGFGEFVRPIQVKDNGPRPDYTSGANDYLRGGAARLRAGPLGLDLFASEKPLDLPLNDDGTVNFNLDYLHEGTGDIQDAAALRNDDTVTERLAGGRLSGGSETWRIGLSGYGLRFNRPFNPEKTDFSDARAFRGDRLALVGADAAATLGPWRLAGEMARSKASGPFAARPGGPAWTASALWKDRRAGLWLGLFDYDPDFVSPHGKGLAYGVSGAPEDLPRNQAGGVLGGEWGIRRWSGRFNATFARFPEAIGNGDNTGSIAPSQARYLLADQRWAPGEGVEFRLVYQEQSEEKRLEDPAWGALRQVAERTQKWRASAEWRPSPRVRWTVRHDSRRERVPALNEERSGHFWMADAVFNPRDGTTLKARAYFFDSPDAYLTTGPEEIWDGVVYSRLAGNLGSLRGPPGTRLYLIARQDIGAARLWAKVEVTRRPEIAEGRSVDPLSPRHAWHVQLDGRWGPKL